MPLTIETLDGLVAAHLRETGTTRLELAEVVGVKSGTTLNQKLTGNSELSLSEAVNLASWLGITVQDLCSIVFGPVATTT